MKLYEDTVLLQEKSTSSRLAWCNRAFQHLEPLSDRHIRTWPNSWNTYCMSLIHMIPFPCTNLLQMAVSGRRCEYIAIYIDHYISQQYHIMCIYIYIFKCRPTTNKYTLNNANQFPKLNYKLPLKNTKRSGYLSLNSSKFIANISPS